MAAQFGGSTNEGGGGKCRRQKVSTSLPSDFQKLDNDARRRDRKRKTRDDTEMTGTSQVRSRMVRSMQVWKNHPMHCSNSANRVMNMLQTVSMVRLWIIMEEGDVSRCYDVVVDE